jgi:hypothetical protein
LISYRRRWTISRLRFAALDFVFSAGADVGIGGPGSPQNAPTPPLERVTCRRRGSQKGDFVQAGKTQKKGRAAGRVAVFAEFRKVKESACFIVVGGTGIEPVTPAV